MSPQAALEATARAGAAAFQAGRHGEARRLLAEVHARVPNNVQIALMLAYSCRALGERGEEERAVDAILKADPGNIRALILKGDCRDAAGDARAASSFYDRAIKQSERVTLPGDLAKEVARARTESARLGRRYRAHLEQWLGAKGAALSPRFAQALDIMFGEKQVYYQQPHGFYFPELPQRQFYERSEFDWVPALEARTETILAELNGLLATREGFRPYLVSNPERPKIDFHGLNDNPDWSSLYLHENGAPVDAHVARAPLSYAALQALPLCRIPPRAPTIMFSLLRPGARIAPHTGMLNTRLICHLPLIVPPGCGFRVGNEVRQWEVGKLLIFDDTIEHEAWNDSDQDRVVLIFDIWRPELTPEERAAIVDMFAAVDAY